MAIVLGLDAILMRGPRRNHRLHRGQKRQGFDFESGKWRC